MLQSMLKSNSTLITKAGFVELKHEYDELVQSKRPELVARITQAREAGDLAENSEYAAAREDLAFIDGRISEIEEILNAAKTVITHKVGKASKIDVGCKVRLGINGTQEIFFIVGEWEANPKERKISHSSPLGKALMGKQVGETVEVTAPVGKIIYKILKIG